MTTIRSKCIAHVGIAVDDIDAACRLWCDTFGGRLADRKLMPAQKVEIAFIRFGNGAMIELLSATAPDSPVGRFLAQHGPGLHHVCLRVDDIEARLAELAKDGFAFIDKLPRPGAENDRIAFLHPSGTNGVLIELSERPGEE
jgi:methylmalonyl-CoA/ethylmalonyl-CoA epimerase